MKASELGLLLFFCTTILYYVDRNELKRENVILKDNTEKLQKSLKWNKKRLKEYYLAALQIDSICDQFKSSRELKHKLNFKID